MAATAIAACGADADAHLRVDMRSDRVELAVAERRTTTVTARDVELAFGVTDAVRDLGLDTAPARASVRPVQALEVAIDALDIAAIRPFWKAVLAYVDEPGHTRSARRPGRSGAAGPALWFQQMDEPRPQRNRIHFDITVVARRGRRSASRRRWPPAAR